MKHSVTDYFADNYHLLLKLAVMMTKDADAGQEVLHDVAVHLIKLEKQGMLAGLENAAAYVAMCIRRAVFSYFRKAARSEPQDPALMDEMYVYPQAEPVYDYVDWMTALESNLSKFSPEMRKAFIDHYLDDYPIEFLAERLAITPNALSQRFKRMRRTLADKSPNLIKHMNLLSLL